MLKFVKQNYDVIWKSFVGSIFMFYFVRFLHLFFGYFFLVVAIYIILFIIAMAIALRYKGAKPAWLVIISFVLGMSGHLIYYKHTCGPNKKDVSVMKPMGDTINAYLITKGKPSSLDSIPNLPYKLKCGSAYSCRFEVDGRRYSVVLQCDGYDDCNLELYSSKTKTGIIYSYILKEEKYIKDDEPLIYSSKRTGICNPMRQ